MTAPLNSRSTCVNPSTSRVTFPRRSMLGTGLPGGRSQVKSRREDKRGEVVGFSVEMASGSQCTSLTYMGVWNASSSRFGNSEKSKVRLRLSWPARVEYDISTGISYVKGEIHASCRTRKPASRGSCCRPLRPSQSTKGKPDCARL